MDGARRTVSADGITVEKRAAVDRFNTPAVLLEITSTADRSMMVTVTEPIPESIPIEDIGFHPDYGGEHWSIADREIVFARTIDAGDEYTTVYGVRGIGGEDITTFVDAETSFSTGEGIATSPGAGDADADPVSALLTEGDDEVVRKVIFGDDAQQVGADVGRDGVTVCSQRGTHVERRRSVSDAALSTRDGEDRPTHVTAVRMNRLFQWGTSDVPARRESEEILILSGAHVRDTWQFDSKTSTPIGVAPARHRTRSSRR
jgi:hypothetical protein